MKKITLILITLFAFIYANAQDYTVPRGLPYKDTRWVENVGVAGASYLFDSLTMFRNMGDTQMKPLYPALAFILDFNGDSTFWIYDTKRWKKLATGSSSSASNNTNLGSAYRWLNETSQGIKTVNKGFGIGLDSLTTGEIRITADTSKLPTRYTIDSLGLLVPPFFSLTAIGGTANANGASYNSTTGVFNLQPYSRAFGGVTTASNTPQYSEGQKGLFSNTDTIATYYGNEVLRSYLYGTGRQVWFLKDPTLGESGSINYSTPLGFPGILFLNPSGTGRSQFRQYRDTGGVTFGSLSPSGIPDNQFTVLNNGHTFVTGYSGSVIGSGEHAIPDSGYLFNVFGTSNLWGKLYLSSVANGSVSDSILVIHSTEVKKVASASFGSGTVTSVGLTMPSAFSVASSPVTTSGTIAVTGAGTTSQYIRGDGSLATYTGGAATDTVNVANVLSFGADSTGVTDATPAFNLAVQYAAANKLGGVYAPHGTYSIIVAALKSGSQVNKQGIQLLNGISLYGDGIGKTTLRAKGQTTGDTSTYNWYPVINGAYRSNCTVSRLSIDGNQDSISIYNSDPYVNPTGHNDSSKHYSVQGIYFKDGDNDQVLNVQIDSCQGFGIDFYDVTRGYIRNSKLRYNGNGAIGFTGRDDTKITTGGAYDNICDFNNSDNIRVVSCGEGVVIFHNQLSNAKNVTSQNAFAGLWVDRTRSVYAAYNDVFGNSAYGLDFGGGDSATAGGARIEYNNIYQNGNGGITSPRGNATIIGNVIHDNGKTPAGVTDTHSNYNPAAIVVSVCPNLTITNNIAYDSVSGTQTYFIKKWGGSPTPAFGFMGSVVSNNRIKAVADTAHAYDGNNGTTTIFGNVITASNGALVNPAADNKFLGLTNGIPVYQAPFTLTATGSSGAATFSGGVLNVPNYGSGVAVTLSSLTAATATNTINNVDYAQEWQWNSLSGNGLKLSASSTFAASNAQTVLNISLNGANSNSSQTTYGLQVSNTHTGGGSANNVAASFTASGTTNNIAVLANGLVGVGNVTVPFTQFHISSDATVSTRGFTLDQHTTDAASAIANFRKSRGTLASPTTVANGDYVAFANFQTYDGTAYRTTAGFGGHISGTVGTNSIPTDLFFFTSPSDDTDPFANSHVRMIIANAGNVLFGVQSAIYRTTNTGSDVTPKFNVNTAGSITTAGSPAFLFDNTNGLVFSAANGAREIARAAINITNLTNTAASETGDLSFYTQSGGTAMAEKMRVTSGGGLSLTGTNTAAGTTGAQTINKPTGQVNFAAGAQTLVVTNSLATTTSVITVTVYGTDATATSARVTRASGSFTITLNATATAETAVGFTVMNNF